MRRGRGRPSVGLVLEEAIHVAPLAADAVDSLRCCCRSVGEVRSRHATFDRAMLKRDDDPRWRAEARRRRRCWTSGATASARRVVPASRSVSRRSAHRSRWGGHAVRGDAPLRQRHRDIPVRPVAGRAFTVTRSSADRPRGDPARAEPVVDAPGVAPLNERAETSAVDAGNHCPRGWKTSAAAIRGERRWCCSAATRCTVQATVILDALLTLSRCRARADQPSEAACATPVSRQPRLHRLAKTTVEVRFTCETGLAERVLSASCRGSAGSSGRRPA